MSEPAPTFCTICGLDDKKAHATPGDCIFGLRAALVRQRNAASLLAFEVSTRFLAIIEDLALRPDVGIPYSILMPTPPGANPSDPVRIHVHNHQVRGVFTAIWKKFHEAGDWSPLKEQEEKILQQHHLIMACLGLIKDVFTQRFIEECPREMLADVKEIGELATRLGVPLPDLGGSQSPLR